MLVRQAVKVIWIDGIPLTKLDVRDSFKEINVCIGYRLDSAELDHLPASTIRQSRVEPLFEVMEGWSGSTRGARSWADLPATAVKYIRRIEEMIEAPVHLLSTSPERDDTIMVHDPFLGSNKENAHLRGDGRCGTGSTFSSAITPPITRR